jgi:hypothetical protein
MPKIKKPPPKRILDHLIKRYHEGRIRSSDLLELKRWMESEPTVPPGDWFSVSKPAYLLVTARTLQHFWNLEWP